jgi:hypothetical protein
MSRNLGDNPGPADPSRDSPRDNPRDSEGQLRNALTSQGTARDSPGTASEPPRDRTARPLGRSLGPSNTATIPKTRSHDHQHRRALAGYPTAANWLAYWSVLVWLDRTAPRPPRPHRNKAVTEHRRLNGPRIHRVGRRLTLHRQTPNPNPLPPPARRRSRRGSAR